MKTLVSFLTIILLFVSNTEKILAQNQDNATLDQLMKEDSTDINTLAAYPENVRQNIFEVSAHPEGVVKLNDVQKKCNEQFKNLLSSYSKEEQQKIWNLTRYNDLISKLANLKKKSNSKIEKVLKDYPKEIHDDALFYASNHADLLISIDQMNKQFSESFESTIKPYPDKTQTAFRELIKTPEVISILNNNMHMTVHLGDIYKNSPALITKHFSDLNLDLAQQKAKDLEEWKQTMKDNPEAKEELKKSSEQYAKDNGYKEDEYRNTNPTVVEHYVYVPYPYWCGYPWWYADPYWYPYPHWYHWGFYYWHDDFVWIGPPSWYFIHWHFHSHHHFYDYPHITHTYINYYHGPRRATSSNSREVNTWIRDNRNNLPKDFLNNDSQRPDRIKEYGKFETNYDEHIKSNPKTPVKREEFLQQHAEEYPNIKPLINEHEKPAEILPVKTEPEIKPETPRPKYEPPVKVPEHKPYERPKDYPIKSPSPRPKEQPIIKPPVKQPQIQPRPKLQEPSTPKIDERKKRVAEKEIKRNSTDKQKPESENKVSH